VAHASTCPSRGGGADRPGRATCPRISRSDPTANALGAGSNTALKSPREAIANVRIPRWLDRGARWLLFTPEVHRLHHSLRLAEQNTNFGSILPI
jgi:hypothetical protein